MAQSVSALNVFETICSSANGEARCLIHIQSGFKSQRADIKINLQYENRIDGIGNLASTNFV